MWDLKRIRSIIKAGRSNTIFWLIFSVILAIASLEIIPLYFDFERVVFNHFGISSVRYWSIFREFWKTAYVIIVFGILHSIGAQEWFKQILRDMFGKFFLEYFWRIIYVTLTFTYLWYFDRNLNQCTLTFASCDSPIYVIPDWARQPIKWIRFSGLIIAQTAYVQSNFLDFLGIRPAIQGTLCKIFGTEAKAIKYFGTQKLEIFGIYRFIRHPMATGGLLFAIPHAAITINNLRLCVFLTLYLLVGSYFEERRLVSIFGPAYQEYQKRVGAFFPKGGMWFKQIYSSF